MVRNIDEINNLNRRSEDPEEYFSVMDLTPEQLKQRLEYTYGAFSIFDLILIMFLTMNEYGDIDEDYLKETLTERLTGLIAGFTEPDDYLYGYATGTANDFIDATIRNQDDDYFTSEDRALLNAEISANAVVNYIEYHTALILGETYKTWKTAGDTAVRDTHKKMDGKKLAIDKVFNVNGVKMRFPMDTMFDNGSKNYIRETINCRCKCEYTSK